MRLFLSLSLLAVANAVAAAQIVVHGPAGSEAFGRQVVVLANGNFVVSDPTVDGPGGADIGAVHLYRANGEFIASLRGAQAGDRVGSGGVIALASGDYAVASPDWANGSAISAGAVTFCDGRVGCDGVVSASNSLVGEHEENGIGAAVTALTDDRYVVLSAGWGDGTRLGLGAVTFVDGAAGPVGPVTAQNSLVGASPFDAVGLYGVAVLDDGDYVVGSPDWDNGAATNAGAATFASGSAGIVGVVSPANSLVGTSANDRVGEVVYPLRNGNYVVASFQWNNGAVTNAGAVTFASGSGGIVGPVSATNSLVGSSPADSIGKDGVAALSNGAYVVESPEWDNGTSVDAGAATFGSATAGVSGLVSPANSLVGSNGGDVVGQDVEPLRDGNYAVLSPRWRNGVASQAGAVTLGNGVTGVNGTVTAANSLVGSSPNDRVGIGGVTVLANGNFVVASPQWDAPPLTNVGAATFVALAGGTSGTVSAANSLTGSTTSDQVGGIVTALPGGDYVVGSAMWDNGALANVGAATRGSGSTGLVGTVSAANSLIGGTANDRVSTDIVALASGHYLLRSPSWDRGGVVDAGAVTFVRHTEPLTGTVSAANSLVGSTADDRVGDADAVAFANANYLVDVRQWDAPGTPNAGAIVLGPFDGRAVGDIDAEHGVLGTVTNGSLVTTWGYDTLRNQLVVGQPSANRVVLHRSGFATAITITGDTPDPSVVGNPVTFVATVTSSPFPVDEGRVRFFADTGESCEDLSPEVQSPTATVFSCTLTFAAPGTSAVRAEYMTLIEFAYSASAAEQHTTRSDALFASGYE